MGLFHAILQNHKRKEEKEGSKKKKKICEMGLIKLLVLSFSFFCFPSPVFSTYYFLPSFILSPHTHAHRHTITECLPYAVFC